MDTLLGDELLERIAGRAAATDAENGFFDDDLADLTRAGYLRAHVPAEYGGAGVSLTDLARAQRRLGAASPATALAVNMHHVWVATARTMARRGDDALTRVFDEAGAGEIFGFGISEPGNDLVLFDSLTKAVPSGDGGYSFTGVKIFTSMAPAWTRLGIFGKDESGDEPKLVFGFLLRDAAGVTIADDWDMLGMRATQSRTTKLDGATVPPERIVRTLPVGPNADALTFGIFSSFLLLVPSVYAGIADRALQIAVEATHRRRSLRTGLALSQDPDIRWKIAEAAMRVDSLTLQLEGLTADVDGGPGAVDHGPDWFRQLAGVKTRVIRTAREVVDLAFEVSGGGAYATGSELARLYRDVLAGIFHPSDDESAHSTVASAVLGPLD